MYKITYTKNTLIRIIIFTRRVVKIDSDLRFILLLVKYDVKSNNAPELASF